MQNSHSMHTQNPPQVTYARLVGVHSLTACQKLSTIPANDQCNIVMPHHPTNCTDNGSIPAIHHHIHHHQVVALNNDCSFLFEMDFNLDSQDLKPQIITRIALALALLAADDRFFMGDDNKWHYGREECTENKKKIRLDVEAHILAMDNDYFRCKYWMGKDSFFSSWIF